MNQNELFDKAKELLAKGDLNGAKDFINEHKDNLGEYFEQAKGLVEGLDLSKGLDGVLDKAKDLGLDLENGAGGLLDKAKDLGVDVEKGAGGLLDKVKGLFGK